VTHRGPFQPLPCWDSVIAPSPGAGVSPPQPWAAGVGARVHALPTPQASRDVPASSASLASAPGDVAGAGGVGPPSPTLLWLLSVCPPHPRGCPSGTGKRGRMCRPKAALPPASAAMLGLAKGTASHAVPRPEGASRLSPVWLVGLACFPKVSLIS